MYFDCISFGLSEVTWLKSECFMESLMKCATRKNRMMFLTSFKFVCTSLFGVQERKKICWDQKPEKWDRKEKDLRSRIH